MINGTFKNTPVRQINGKAEVYSTSATSKSGTTVVLENTAQGEKIDIKLTSNGGATGKNIFDYVAFCKNNGYVLQNDGTWYGESKSIVIYENTNNYSGAFTLSSYCKREEPTVNSFVWKVDYTDNTVQYFTAGGADGLEYRINTTNSAKIVSKIVWTYQDRGSHYVRDIQIEHGSIATDYEPYTEDLEGIKVTARGKNLIDISVITTDENSSIVTSMGDGTLKHRATTTGAGGVNKDSRVSATLQELCPTIEVGKTYTLSATTTCESKKYVYLSGNYNKSWAFGTSLTITEAMLTDKVLWYSMGDNVYVYISNIQIEEGTTATAYVPYKKPNTAIAAADGTVQGITSIAPTTVLQSASGAIISANYNTTSLVDTYTHEDRLKSFTLERLGENKFFGFGVCQKANIKLIDIARDLDFTTNNRFKLYLNSTGFTAPLKVTEVNRNENTNELSITAYDGLEGAGAHTVAEITLDSYTIAQFAEACATFCGATGIDTDGVAEFDLFYEGGANFDGAETIREALNAVAEATQTIYYLSADNVLVFKRLDMEEEPVATIDKNLYFDLDSKTNRRLVGICSATELGDNVEAKLDISGTTQYVRNNAFWELRQDIDTLVKNALAAVGGLSINQFNCKWRGDYLLEIGDKIALQTKDNDTVISYLLNDSINYNGALNQVSQWEYTDAEESAANPATLGEVIKQTYAKVDKANKQIDIVASELGDAKSELAAMQITTDKISASVQSIENSTVEAVEGINKELNTLTKKVEAQITDDDVKIQIEEELANGVNSVCTTTGFTFNENGLTVSKSDSEISTTITDDGMNINKGSREVLTANNEGVKAIDLHATTFLVIGNNSRFEDYKSNRTACFWIGG